MKITSIILKLRLRNAAKQEFDDVAKGHRWLKCGHFYPNLQQTCHDIHIGPKNNTTNVPNKWPSWHIGYPTDGDKE